LIIHSNTKKRRNIISSFLFYDFLYLNTNDIAPNNNASINIKICSGHVVGNCSASCPALNKSITTSSEFRLSPQIVSSDLLSIPCTSPSSFTVGFTLPSCVSTSFVSH
jgi:hypothetical protein